MNIVVLDSNTLGADIDLSVFKKYGELTVYEKSSQEEAKERVKDADIIITNKVMLNEETLGKASHLRLICVTATGTNNVDFDYTNSKNITVTNVSGYSTPTVMQHTFAMLFYLLEKLRTYDEYVKSGEYIKSPAFTYLGESFNDITGMTYGIIGLGAIGREVAKVAQAFGCRVIYYSTSGRNNNCDYERVDLDTLLRESDIISIHAPLNENTQGLINLDNLNKMKKSAILLNLGRGPIVNENDLAYALKNDIIAAAGLDVLTREPMTKDNPLFDIKDSRKLLITPHMAWGSVEARRRLMEEVCKNIEAYINGKERNVVR